MKVKVSKDISSVSVDGEEFKVAKGVLDIPEEKYEKIKEQLGAVSSEEEVSE